MRKLVLCLMVMLACTFSLSALAKTVATKIAFLPTAEKGVDIWDLEFSPDNVHVAVGSGTKLQIWDWRKKHVDETIELPPGGNPRLGTRPIQYSPDGELLALLVSAADDVGIRVYGTATWSVKSDLLEHEGSGVLRALTFTHDSNYLLVAKDRGGPGEALVAYDRKSWRQVWGLDFDAFRPEFLRLSPDGKRLAVDGKLAVVAPPSVTDASERSRLYKLKPQTYIFTLPNRTLERIFEGEAVGSLAWSADSDHIAIFGNQNFEMYDVKTGMLINNLKYDGLGRTCAEFTRDGRYFIDSDANARNRGKGIHIWDSSKSHVLQSIPGDSFHMAVSPDSKSLVTDAGSGAQVWRLD